MFTAPVNALLREGIPPAPSPRAGEKQEPASQPGLAGATPSTCRVKVHRSQRRGISAVAKRMDRRQRSWAQSQNSFHRSSARQGFPWGKSVGAAKQGGLVLSALGTHSCVGCQGGSNGVCHGMFPRTSQVDMQHTRQEGDRSQSPQSVCALLGTTHVRPSRMLLQSLQGSAHGVGRHMPAGCHVALTGLTHPAPIPQHTDRKTPFLFCVPESWTDLTGQMYFLFQNLKTEEIWQNCLTPNTGDTAKCHERKSCVWCGGGG